MNNYERIKSMTVDEMIEWISNITACRCEQCILGDDKHTSCTSDCENGIKQWLLSEVEDVNI